MFDNYYHISKSWIIAKKIEIIRKLSTSYVLFISSVFGYRQIRIGKNVHIHSSSLIQSSVDIGDYTGIAGKIEIKGGANATIGKFCAIGSDIKIITTNHKINTANLQMGLNQKLFQLDLVDRTKKGVIIGSNVWIGDSVIILPGVTIGDGAIIGAGSIVTKSVLPLAIYAGNPARHIRNRFSDKVTKQLLKIKWWNWPMGKIKANKALFTLDLINNPEISLDKLIR